MTRRVGRPYKAHKDNQQLIDKFCKAFAVDQNLIESYRAAGYDTTGMTPQSIHNTAKRLLSHPDVARKIAKIQREAADSNEINLNWYVNQSLTMLYEARAEGDIKSQFRALELILKACGITDAEQLVKSGVQVVLSIPDNKRIVHDAASATPAISEIIGEVVESKNEQ